MKETTAKKRGLSSDRIFDIFNYALMAVIMIVVAYPLYYVLIASISNPYEVYAGHTFLLPADITFEGYARVFKEPAIAMGYLNSIWYTVLGTVVTVAMTITTGYCMSKKTLPFRRAIMLFFVFTMYFNGGLIPTYLVVSKLQLLDSVWALILPGGISVYNVIVTRTFFETSVPGEIYEAASIDGSGNLETYFKIALPPCKAYNRRHGDIHHGGLLERLVSGAHLHERQGQVSPSAGPTADTHTESGHDLNDGQHGRRLCRGQQDKGAYKVRVDSCGLGAHAHCVPVRAEVF